MEVSNAITTFKTLPYPVTGTYNYCNWRITTFKKLAREKRERIALA